MAREEFRERSSEFPDDLDSPSVKMGKKWALDTAHAIYYYYKNVRQNLFWGNKDLMTLIERYMLGRNSQDEFKPDIGVDPNDRDNSFVGNLDFQIKNYATKYIRIVVSKILDHKYIPSALATDTMSNKERKDFKGDLKVYVKDKPWIDAIGQSINRDLKPQGVSEMSMPENEEEVDLFMEFEHKLVHESKLERRISKVLMENEWEEQRKVAGFDLAALGVGVALVNTDESSSTIVDRLHPGDCMFPSAKTGDFNDMPWGAHWVNMNKATFFRTTSGELSKDDQNNLWDKYALTRSIVDTDNDHEYSTEHMCCMYFERRTIDELTLLSFKDPFGNDRVIQKDFFYYRSDEEKEKFEKKFKGARKILRIPHQTVYRGYWIQGSETVFQWRRKNFIEHPNNNKYRAQIGYKVVAPDMRDGLIISLGEQLIPMLKDLQRYNLKIQDLIAKEIPQIVKINLRALRSANLEWGKEDMDDKKKVDLLWQKGLFIEGEVPAGSSSKSIELLGGGIANDLERYLKLIQQALFEIEEIIGINKPTAAGTLSPDAGKATTELQIQASETALDFIYKADQRLMQKIQSAIAGIIIQKDQYEGDNVFENHRYDIDIEALPTQQEWRDFLITLQQAKNSQQITLAEYTIIKNVRNLKRANLMLKLADSRNRRLASEAAQQNAEINSNEQAKAAQNKHQMDVDLLKAERGNMVAEKEEERKLVILEHSLEMDKLVKEKSLESAESEKDRESTAERDLVKILAHIA